MPIEKLQTQLVSKPWGARDLSPWCSAATDGQLIGEVLYERSESNAPLSQLRLKVLFADQPLSIQVHPNDESARKSGSSFGKTESWYILAASPQAKVALGLKRSLNGYQLRRAIRDGSIADEVVWKSVAADDVLHVPAGTIHAIGAGLVLAEIQQRSDTTYRMFDYGRDRALHVDEAVASALTLPAEFQVRPNRLSEQRTLLVSDRHFIFERIDLPPSSKWLLDTRRESWMFVLGGTAVATGMPLHRGDALFAEDSATDLAIEALGMELLLAYPGQDGPLANLLVRET